MHYLTKRPVSSRRFWAARMEKFRKEEQVKMEKMYVEDLFRFIENSPTAFHAVDTMKKKLEARGYTGLLESGNWKLEAGGKYYAVRNGSSLIAFRIPKSDFKGFQIMASHSDSPCLKIKENPELKSEAYVKLNVEKYGGMLCATWFDRPLSVAGRAVVRENDRIITKLVHVKRDLLMIPSLAIHMNREANDGYKYNVQKDMLPLYGMYGKRESEESMRTAAGQETEGAKQRTPAVGKEAARMDFMEMIARETGVNADAILGSELYLYNRMAGSIWGENEEFISAGRLDDLECAYASLQAFLEAEAGCSIPVHCVFDNEEVGSSTRQGAASTFLADTLYRICEALKMTGADYRRALASSLMLSADNAHAVHPNYSDKACPSNRPLMNRGIVVKFSGNQRYTSDAVSAALFRSICEKAKVPVQVFTNRSDMLGGSTLGNISGTQVAVSCVDIGLAQLAMHSSYETAGAKDLEYLVQAAKIFYESSVEETGAGEYLVQHCVIHR